MPFEVQSFHFLLVSFLLGGNVLEILLKNIHEFLKFNVINISQHCSSVALSNKIATDILGEGISQLG